jgi:hypothetical protein
MKSKSSFCFSVSIARVFSLSWLAEITLGADAAEPVCDLLC